MEKILVIIPASGKGSRYGSALPKQLLPFGATTILEHTIEKFKHTKFTIDICLIIHDINDTLYHSIHQKVQYCVEGGAERQVSISNAILSDFAPMYDIIAVHDAVRPLVSCTLIEELISQTMEKGAVIPALPIKDTLKTFSDNRITATLNRESILAVQTPQVFHSSVIISSYRTALSSKELFTDDSSLVEYSGHPVYYIQGETNIKITTPSDYQYANFLIHKNLAH